jgi:hypothetical protein
MDERAARTAEKRNTYQWVITTLVGVVGLLSGIGLAHFAILSKVNQVVVVQARTEEQIGALTRGEQEQREMYKSTMRLHEETLKAVATLIQQNTILIERR